MSNDDRDAPRWGERTPEPEQEAPATTPLPATPAAPAPDADQPRYGERVAPGSAPGSWSAPSSASSSAPASSTDAPPSWSAPSSSSEPGSASGGYTAPPSQQYGGQPGQPGQQYGGQQYAAQQQWGQPAPDATHGAWGSERPRHPRTVGVIAFVAGIAALVLGVVAAVLFGTTLVGLPGFRDAVESNNTEQLQRVIQDNPNLAGPFVVGALLYLAGTAVGIWAIVQGLIATIRARGRAFGIIALILGVVAPIVSVFVLTGSLGSALG